MAIKSKMFSGSVNVLGCNINANIVCAIFTKFKCVKAGSTAYVSRRLKGFSKNG